MNANTIGFVAGGQAFVALANRGLFWPKQKALLIADTHLGKDAVFRREGVPLPEGTDAETLRAIESLVEETGAEKMWVLGDFLHGEVEVDDPLVLDFNRWRASMPKLNIEVTRGNHDRHLRDSGLFEGVEWVDQRECEGIALRHHPPEEDGLFALAGHLHPCFRLRQGRKAATRLPVFWIRERCLVLPAFSEFTGCYAVAPGPADRLIAALPGGPIWIKES